MIIECGDTPGPKITCWSGSGGSPLNRRKLAVKLQILIDHALVVVAVPRALICPVGVGPALLPIFGKIADGCCQARGVVRPEVHCVLTPDLAITRDVVSHNRAAGERGLQWFH